MTSTFKQMFIGCLNNNGYKSALTLLQEKVESDRDFKLIVDNLLSDAVSYNDFNKYFNERIEHLPSDEVIENLGIKLRNTVFSPIKIKFKDIIAIYILYLNRLANTNAITYSQYVNGNSICDDIRDNIDNRTFNYIINISNYYVINDRLLSTMDHF